MSVVCSSRSACSTGNRSWAFSARQLMDRTVMPGRGPCAAPTVTMADTSGGRGDPGIESRTRNPLPTGVAGDGNHAWGLWVNTVWARSPSVGSTLVATVGVSTLGIAAEVSPIGAPVVPCVGVVVESVDVGADLGVTGSSAMTLWMGRWINGCPMVATTPSSLRVRPAG